MVEAMCLVNGMDDRVNLSVEFHAELRWRNQLLTEWNGVSLLLNDQWTSNADFEFWSDASGNGFGSFWHGSYLLGEFTD